MWRTLHYSDFWTNAKDQDIPHRWAAHLATLPDESARMTALTEFISARTRVVLQAMVQQGTPPTFVSLGNEIDVAEPVEESIVVSGSAAFGMPTQITTRPSSCR